MNADICDSFTFTDPAGYRLFAQSWLPGPAPKGIVEIAHGMNESTSYYSEFVSALCGAGYGVYINDARGHGRTAGPPHSPEFEKNAGEAGPDGFNGMVDDLRLLRGIIAGRHPKVPVFLLGHSMGSLLSRLYAAKYGETLSGLIYSGTAGPFQNAGALLAAAEKEEKVMGRSAVARAVPELLFGHFNDRFEPTKTGREYMSRDEAMVADAISSPFSPVPYRCGFFVDMARALGTMDLPETIAAIPKGLPIFSISGSMDPLGEYGEGVPRLFSLYRGAGISDAGFIVYEGGRHEMLREINRRKVFADVVAWLDRHAAVK